MLTEQNILRVESYLNMISTPANAVKIANACDVSLNDVDEILAVIKKLRLLEVTEIGNKILYSLKKYEDSPAHIDKIRAASKVWVSLVDGDSESYPAPFKKIEAAFPAIAFPDGMYHFYAMRMQPGTINDLLNKKTYPINSIFMWRYI